MHWHRQPTPPPLSPSPSIAAAARYCCVRFSPAQPAGRCLRLRCRLQSELVDGNLVTLEDVVSRIMDVAVQQPEDQIVRFHHSHVTGTEC